MSDLHFVPQIEGVLRSLRTARGITALTDYGFLVEWSEADGVSWSNENDPRVFGREFKRDIGVEFPPFGPVDREVGGVEAAERGRRPLVADLDRGLCLTGLRRHRLTR